MTRAGGLPQSAHCNRLSRVALAKDYVEQTTNTQNPTSTGGCAFWYPPCSSGWIQSWPPRQRHQRPGRTCRSSCPAGMWRQSQGWGRENNNNNTEKRKQSIRRPFFCSVKVKFGNNRECVTCQRAPGHLWAEHTWFWARTLGQGSRHPGSHPCAEHEPVGSQSAGRRSSTHKKQVSQFPQNRIWCTHHITYCVF